MSFRRSTGSRSGARPAVVAACLILAFAISAGGALADWQDDYKAGVAAVERSDYDGAIRLLGQAIRDKPRERASAIKSTGMFFDPYLPHYYLGLALYGRKEYERALQELRISASQGVINKYPDQNGRLESHLKLCEQQVAAGAGGPGAEDKEAKALAVARERAAQRLEEAGTFLQRRGAELTSEERGKVESAMKELSQASDTSTIALKAGDLNSALEATGRALLEREGRPARPTPGPIPPQDRPPRELGRIPPGSAPRERPSAPDAGPRGPAPQQIAPPSRTGPSKAGPPPPEPPRPERPGPAAPGRLPAPTPESDSRIRRGMESYFKGDDEGAISALTGVEQADADFYLGSALYRKYLLGRGQDPALKDEAARHFKRVAEISPGYRPDKRYFSPKMIAFFEEAAGRR